MLYMIYYCVTLFVLVSEAVALIALAVELLRDCIEELGDP